MVCIASCTPSACSVKYRVKNECSFWIFVEKYSGDFFFNRKSISDTVRSNSSGEYHEGIIDEDEWRDFLSVIRRSNVSFG